MWKGQETTHDTIFDETWTKMLVSDSESRIHEDSLNPQGEIIWNPLETKETKVLTLLIE